MLLYNTYKLDKAKIYINEKEMYYLRFIAKNYYVPQNLQYLSYSTEGFLGRGMNMERQWFVETSNGIAHIILQLITQICIYIVFF